MGDIPVPKIPGYRSWKDSHSQRHAFMSDHITEIGLDVPEMVTNCFFRKRISVKELLDSDNILEDYVITLNQFVEVIISFF